MSTTAAATLQTIWDCRFSRHGYRLTGVVDASQPEPPWVCVRGSGRRPVRDEDCEACPYWVEEQVTPCP